MKPETIERRAAKRITDAADRKAIRIDRLRELTTTHGPDSIWAELLAMEGLTTAAQLTAGRS